MKLRHILVIMAGSALVLWSLASCDLLGGTTIDQRVSNFQSDLNTSTRTNVYNDFHPTQTTQYNALKDPATVGFNTTYPPPGPSYSLSIVDKSNTSAVIVLVSAGSHATWAVPYYLSLNMAQYNSNDWRIVSISDSQTNGSYTVRYQ